MPQKCSICARPEPEKESIDMDILKGVPLRNIAEQYGTTPTSLFRHKQHLTTKLATFENEENGRIGRLADDIIGQVKDLNSRVYRILSACEQDGDRRNALAAIREAKGLIELQGRLMGNFTPAIAVQVNNVGRDLKITDCPEYPVLSHILDHHPEIRKELAEALAGAGL
jgi:hypothetical protein